jgi:hypothetical protein
VCFGPGKPFQPSLIIFASKAGSYPSGAPFRLLILPANIRPSLKYLPGTNALAYSEKKVL